MSFFPLQFIKSRKDFLENIQYVELKCVCVKKVCFLNGKVGDGIHLTYD